MDATYGQDLSLIDMDDLGVRPSDSIDFSKAFDNSIEELFGQEKPSIEFQVYSAGELKFTKEDVVMSEDDDDDDEYEIDPETG